MRKKLVRPKVVLASAVVCLFAAAVVWIDLLPYFEYRTKAHEVKSLAEIGSDVDATRDLLIANGFSCSKKEDPTGANRVYWVSVSVANERRPFTLVLLWFFGYKDYYHYIVVESATDGKIVRTIP